MNDRFRDTIRRLRTSLTREVLLYIVFGVLTTVVNYVVFIGLNSLFGKDTPLWNGGIRLLSWSWDLEIRFWWLSNAIAFVAAVSFAFVTNRTFVFEAGGKSAARGDVIRQGLLFWTARLVTLALEYAILFLLIDTLGISDLLSKVVSNFFVIVGNYFFSKFVVFRPRTTAPQEPAVDAGGPARGR